MPLQFSVNTDGTVDILAKQGEHWEFSVTVTDVQGTPIDLTGYTAVSQIKTSYQSDTAVASFTATVSDPANGKVDLYLDPATTSQITAAPTSIDGVKLKNLKVGSPGVYVYDVKVYTTDKAYRILEGKLAVDPGVSS